MHPPLRIRYVFDRTVPGPTTDCEQVVRNVHALQQQGAQVRLIVPCDAQGRAVDADVVRQHYQLPSPIEVDSVAHRGACTEFQRKQRYPRWVAAEGKDADADVVYTRNLPVVRHYVRHGKPVVYDTYRAWGDQLPMLRPWLRAVLNSPHCIGVVLHSEYALGRYAAMGVRREKMRVAYNGFDPRFFSARPTQAQARAELGLPADKRIVTYSGHVNFTKGLWAMLKLARNCPDHQFLLVGVQNMPLYQKLTRQVPNVTLVPWGPMSTVVQYLIASDVLLIPPSSAPLQVIGHTVLPMKIFLYLAVGRPILASRTRDVVELLKDGHNAVLVEPGDITAAAEKLRWLRDRPAAAEQIAARAREQSEQLTWAARARQVHAFIEQRYGAYIRQSKSSS